MQSEKFFQNIAANIIIVITLAVLFSACCLTGSITFTPSAMTKPYYKGQSEENEVSLMFNVYWGTEYLIPILDVLDDYGVKATFFVGGCWADDNNALLTEIIDRGHEIGNHGYFHKEMDTISLKKQREELLSTDRLVEAITGYKMCLFAAPGGAYNNNTLKVCEDADYKLIMWSKDTIDWRDHNSDLIYNRATKKLTSGDLILAHPTKETLNALPRILKYYLDNGFKQVVVSKNISLEIL